MSLSVKQYYVSSTLTFGAILLTGCAGAVISSDRMAIGAIGRSYIEACKEPVKENAITSLANQSVQLEARAWARFVGDAEGNTAATTVPLEHEKYCVKIGNNTPPSGFWASFMDFLGGIAPYVAMAFGIPAL